MGKYIIFLSTSRKMFFSQLDTQPPTGLETSILPPQAQSMF